MSMKRSLLLILGVTSMVLLAWSNTAMAYDQYRLAGGQASCRDCHPRFQNGPGDLLHDMHTQMTEECLLCHRQIGDVPKTWTSGAAGGQGCRGCHGVDNGTEFNWGAGLRAHHANAGAPPDQNGLFCSDCHGDDPPPSPESTTPVYYLRADVNVMDPCVSMLPDGEDYSSDGQGLDNDGDLVYDENDSDCSSSGIGDGPANQPLALSLISIAPNPVTARGTDVFYSLPTGSDVTIGVYDMSGRLVRSRVYTGLSPGRQIFHFDGKDVGGRPLPSGVYMIRLETRESVVRGRTTLIR